ASGAGAAPPGATARHTVFHDGAHRDDDVAHLDRPASGAVPPAHRPSPADIPLPPLPAIPSDVAARLDADAAAQWRSAHAPALTPHAPTVYILRGISGAGKSHIARLISDVSPPGSVSIVSADDYFVRLGGGVYAFDFSRL